MKKQPTRQKISMSKAMHDLNVVIDQDCTNNERIKELIEWYRKECPSVPGMDKGDHVVIEAIRKAAATGLSLDFSIMEAYRTLTPLTPPNNHEWDKLREEFFTECSANNEFPEGESFKVFTKNPEAVFDWFKSRIHLPSSKDSVMYREVQTPDDIMENMIEVMPFRLSDSVKPYVLEAIKIGQSSITPPAAQPVSVSREETIEGDRCLKCGHEWSHEDDACPECGSQDVDCSVQIKCKLSTTQPVKIDEEEIDEIICRIVEYEDWDGLLHTEEAAHEIAKHFTHQPAKVDEVWISVEDRLPENDDPVNIYDATTGKVSTGEYNEEWYDDVEEARTYHTITHWQPLPGKPSPN